MKILINISYLKYIIFTNIIEQVKLFYKIIKNANLYRYLEWKVE